MPMVRDARVTGPISRAVCHHEPVRAVDSISLPTFIELLKNHPLVREKKGNSIGRTTGRLQPSNPQFGLCSLFGLSQPQLHAGLVGAYRFEFPPAPGGIDRKAPRRRPG